MLKISIFQVSHHTRTVRCLALLPDGRRFVSGAFDNTACIVEHGLAPPWGGHLT